MRTVWILGDQLSVAHSALAEADRGCDRVLFVESRKRGAHLRYHKVKLAMVYAAMRHFAEDLRAEGWKVDYHRLADTEDFWAGLSTHISAQGPDELVMMEPNSWFEREAVVRLARKAGLPLRFTQPVQFLRTREDFAEWAAGRKRLLMETHYRTMRTRLKVLVDASGGPEGGTWNLDAENRKTASDWAKAGRPLPPAPLQFAHDAITREAVADVEKYFSDAPGSAEKLWVPVTRADARAALGDFIEHRLALFGDYEDTMISGEPRLFHSLLSAPINLGLLGPMEVVEAAVRAFHKNRVPLNAVEGFVRQILGWREFINGVYWLKMPGYAESNGLGAERPLPGFFYSGETDMACLRETLAQVRETAYNHHIQRLMILGNFLLLAGINPQQALRWFSEMYVDAFDWVMAANVLGMSLHADGGFMATKPYAGAASYISKMSDYCKGCRYQPATKHGPGACPFNLLYWDFYDRHGERFASNPRTAMMIRAWRRRPHSERQKITAEAAAFLAGIGR